ncbi:hypothetical protein LSH36_275g02024 [Paralvinella palmiformis]|uniref:G-protein coupled receptors family 1 profile domain-containing protein n=1 Tax=Paralvinella palmiformis TaxID=53620 RepID=A0AAD9N3J9_9ANNE|nr:hypothetical protein LSH36_275g02024 [Paralvinella palmiformis]
MDFSLSHWTDQSVAIRGNDAVVTSYWSDVSSASDNSTSGSLDVGLVVCAGLLMIGSVMGNVFVFVALESAANLRQRNNVLILSLAASDLLRGAICLPLLIIILIGDPNNGSTTCAVFNCFRISLDTSTLLHIALVSLERGFVISSPLIYERIVSRKKMITCVVIAWSVSFCYGIPQMVWSFNYDADQFQSCYVQAPMSFIVFDFLFRFVLPLLCIVVSNCKICHVVNGHIVKMQATVSSQVSQCSHTVRSTNSPRIPMTTDGRCSKTTQTELARRHLQEVRSESSPIMVETSGIASSVGQSLTENQSIKNSGQTLKENPEGTNLDGSLRNLNDGLVLSAVSCVRHSSDEKCSSGESTKIKDTTTLSRSLSLPQISASSQQSPILRRPSASSIYANREKRHSVSFQITPQDHQNDAASCSLQVVRGDRTGVRRDSTLSSEDSTTKTKFQVRRNSKVWTIQDDELCSGYYSEQHSTSSSTTSRSSYSGRRRSRTDSRRFSNVSLQKNKAAKLTIALIVTFVACYLPLEICSMLYTVCSSCISLLAMNVAVIVALSSSLLNPLVYNFYSHEFRKATKEALLSLIRRKG